jgi:hypothetical protein
MFLFGVVHRVMPDVEFVIILQVHLRGFYLFCHNYQAVVLAVR